MNPNKFLAELKRRNVYNVAVVYAVVAWLLIQAGSILFPTFEAPGWVMKVFVTVVAAGFPIALILAWAFELTPEGIKRTELVESEGPSVRSRGSAWIYVVIVAGAISAGLFFLGRPTSKQSEAGQAPVKSIAVLPFENLSRDPDNTYFAEGIKDELLARLSKVADLKVISIRSTEQLRSSPDDLTQIARKFGVANILAGSVQRRRSSLVLKNARSSPSRQRMWRRISFTCRVAIFGTGGRVRTSRKLSVTSSKRWRRTRVTRSLTQEFRTAAL